MNTNLNQLEALNKEHCGINFIKTYEVLNITDLSPAKIRLIELILSFQSNDQVFQMRYEVIGKRLGISPYTIKQYVSELKKLGLITTNNIKNYKTDSGKGGSRTYIKVDIDSLTNYIEKFKDMRKMPQQPIPETQPESKVMKAEEKPVKPIVAQVEETPTKPLKQPETRVSEGEKYPLKESDFNTRLMLLRYTDSTPEFETLIKHFDAYWVKNGKGIIQLEFLVEYLFEENKKEKSNLITKILEGIAQDFQQKAA